MPRTSKRRTPKPKLPLCVSFEDGKTCNKKVFYLCLTCGLKAGTLCERHIINHRKANHTVERYDPKKIQPKRVRSTSPTSPKKRRTPKLKHKHGCYWCKKYFTHRPFKWTDVTSGREYILCSVKCRTLLADYTHGPPVESQQGEFLSHGVEAPDMESYSKGAGLSPRIVHISNWGWGKRCGECKKVQRGPQYSDCGCGNLLNRLSLCYCRVIYYRASWWYRWLWNGPATRIIKKYEVKNVKIKEK